MKERSVHSKEPQFTSTSQSLEVIIPHCPFVWLSYKSSEYLLRRLFSVIPRTLEVLEELEVQFPSVMMRIPLNLQVQCLPAEVGKGHQYLSGPLMILKKLVRLQEAGAGAGAEEGEEAGALLT